MGNELTVLQNTFSSLIKQRDQCAQQLENEKKKQEKLEQELKEEQDKQRQAEQVVQKQEQTSQK